MSCKSVVQSFFRDINEEVAKRITRDIFVLSAGKKKITFNPLLLITPSHHRHNIFYFRSLLNGETKLSWKYVCEAGKVFACCWHEATTEQATREEKKKKKVWIIANIKIFSVHTYTHDSCHINLNVEELYSISRALARMRKKFNTY
jgi:hypothetical protein